MFYRLLRPLGFSLLFLVLTACTTLGGQKTWPENLPPRQVFVDGYLSKRNLSTVEDAVLDAHLVWIKRFYQGTLVYPNGWNRASRLFLESVDSEHTRTELQNKLYALGIEIAIEWAQSNEIRLINSANIATWGSAMQTAAEHGDHSAFVNKVESDVTALIAKTLQASEIRYERYYPEEDYDNF